MVRLDLGADIYIIKKLYLNLGISLNYGLLDINSTDWQLKGYKEFPEHSGIVVLGDYTASHNIYAKINI